MMRRALLLSAVLVASYAAGPLPRPACAQTGPSAEIVVEVNGTPITRADLDEALLMDEDYLRIKRLGSSAAAAELLREAENRVLESLIDEIILLAAAREARISLSPEEERGVQGEFEEKVKERWGSLDALEEELKNRRIRIDHLRQRFRNGFIIRKLAHEEMGRGGFVRPEDLKRYYEEHKESYQEPVKGVVAIIRVLKTGRDPKDAREMIDDADRQLTLGRSFADIAREYPEGPNADGGGTLEVVRTVEEIRASWRPAVAGLKEGERSKVFETPDDFVIVKVVRLPSSDAKTFEQVQDTIYTELEDRTRRERVDALRDRLRRSAFINPKDPLHNVRSK